MSIIYDALKKVEESSDRDEKLKINKEPVKSRPKHKVFLLYLLIACLGIFLANIFLIFLSRPLPKNTIVVVKNPPISINLPSIQPKEKKPQFIETPPPVPAEAKAEPKESFILNGVFFSNDEGYALINNRIVKEGDKIDGATVARIALGEAELELRGEVIKLSSSSQ